MIQTKLIQNDNLDSKLKEFRISRRVSIKKKKKWILENKLVYMESDISCSGTLILRNCRIYYDGQKYAGKIFMKSGSTLKLEDVRIDRNHNGENRIVCESYVSISSERSNWYEDHGVPGDALAMKDFFQSDGKEEIQEDEYEFEFLTNTSKSSDNYN